MPTKKAEEEKVEKSTKKSTKKITSSKKPITKKTAEKKVTKKTLVKKVAVKKTTNKAAEEKTTEKKKEKKELDKEILNESPKSAPKDIKTKDDFNWTEFEEGIQTVDSKQIEEFDKLIDENFVDTYNDNVIIGEVLNITEREAIIDINAKSEGVISLNEFRYNPDLKVGDKVEVIVDVQEDKTGQLVLSHRKARTIKAWERVIESHEKETVVTGFVKFRTKGGMIVDVFGLEAFLPGSQIDVKPIRDYDQYVNKNMEFRVVKINHEFKNVVVSHKALIEADIEEQKKEIISQLEKGQVLEGIVKNITTYGVFVDLGGVDGLIHITDLSWNRINHPSEILDLDQKLNVVILDFDDDKSRIQLGVKQLSNHPWENLDSNLKEGDKIKGKVSVIADYGAFIEVIDGVEGLVHVSEMSWSTHLRSAQDFVNVGDEVEALILTLDREDRKMSLGIKQLTNDPWTDITSKYPSNSRHKGKIRNFTNFGVFVELEEGIDGLVYISDLSWTQKVKHPSELFSISDEIDVVVLDLDVNERKLSLGHKQTTKNPWDKCLNIYAVDTVHELSIDSIGDKGATINLPDELSAIVPKKHMIKEDGSILKEGENANFKVIECNSEFKRIVMSHTSTFKSANSVISKKSKKKEKIDKSTLGDIEALADLKKQFEDDEKIEK
ncbi:MAG: 30S ribosomal protein S1 [Flavobacteriaceae bacterium]|nr:30S ribosomal protein S1 [Flavobacteriaceae bacterium]MBL6683904.1 30S ribosomal protein S1 [Flavobacteriaceae bacterium]